MAFRFVHTAGFRFDSLLAMLAPARSVLAESMDGALAHRP
jgi:hypothetical protein